MIRCKISDEGITKLGYKINEHLDRLERLSIVFGA